MIESKILPPSYYYQSEKYNIAWGLEHYGFYTDQNGKVYQFRANRDFTYGNSDNWNMPDIDSNLILEEKLLENLSNCFKQYKSETMPFLTNEIVEDLKRSPIKDFGRIRCDAGSKSNCIYVLNPETNNYERILLSLDGDFKKVNTSKYAQTIITKLGEAWLNFK